MPGSWELGGPNTLVVTLTRELVTTKWAAYLRQLQLPPNSDIRFISGAPYDHARNIGCEEALARGFEWVFMLDDDVIGPANMIQILQSNKMPIVSGLYYRRHEPICPVALVDTEKGRQWVTGYTPGTLFAADYVGAGALLIHRTVLEKMKWPWFEWWSDRKDMAEKDRMSEDFAFCQKARQLGYKIYVDSRADCAHAGLSEMSARGVKALSLT